jgi:hypothetical protein
LFHGQALKVADKITALQAALLVGAHARGDLMCLVQRLADGPRSKTSHTTDEKIAHYGEEPSPHISSVAMRVQLVERAH